MVFTPSFTPCLFESQGTVRWSTERLNVIPEFSDFGYLPSGVYEAKIAEVSQRFGQEPEIRRAQIESLAWLLDAARRSGVLRVIIDGSFVTDAYEPNDVDCILLLGADYPKDVSSDAEVQQGFPFIHAELGGLELFDYYVKVFFATDRRGVPKGMIEVLL